MNDRYRIDKELARSRFASTFAATDLETGDEVVLKRISSVQAYAGHAELDALRSTEGEKIIELFKREAEILRQLDHPGIPKYIDFFTEKRPDDLYLCLVQEKLDGKTLKEVLESKRFTETEVLDIGIDVADILAYLHELSPPLIHRDVKPSNIMLKKSGEIAVIDFGAVMDALEPDTGGSTIIGTFGYMPIEQYEGRAVAASDVYSLGVTMIALLSRKRPRDLERLNMRLDFRPHVNLEPRVANAIDRMIDIDPTRRPQDGRAVGNLLRSLRGMGASPPLRPRSSPPEPGPSFSEVGSMLESLVTSARKTFLPILTLAVGVALIYIISELWDSWRGLFFIALALLVSIPVLIGVWRSQLNNADTQPDTLPVSKQTNVEEERKRQKARLKERT